MVLTRFCGVPPAKRAKLARASMCARVRGEVSSAGKFTIVNAVDKMQTRGRPSKFPEMSRNLKNYIVQGWYSGTPVTRQACYMKCREWSKKGSLFFKQYVDPDKSDAAAQLCHWVSRLLRRIGYSSRKETISQRYLITGRR